MITIFAIPKYFKGNLAIIQRNAIKSWTLLRPKVDIILLGDDDGTSEIAKEFGLRHIQNIKRNEFGTPLMDSMFREVVKDAKTDILALVNADIILFSDFLEAAKRVHYNSFLMVGRRYDLNIDYLIDFNRSWEKRLLEEIQKKGSLHSYAGADYFIFNKKNWLSFPPFAVGRCIWDNWFIFDAKQRKIPIIDATAAITAVHQNHDYSHIPQGEEGVRRGEEKARNRKLAKRLDYSCNILDSEFLLTGVGLIKKRKTQLLYREAEVLSRQVKSFGFESFNKIFKRKS